MTKQQLEAKGFEVRSHDLRNVVVKGKNLSLRTGGDTCSLNVKGVAVRIAEGLTVKEIIDVKKSMENSDLKVSVDPFGGHKVVQIWNKSNNALFAEGIASCSNLDRFNKKTGFKIALGRAVKDLGSAEAEAE